MTFTAQNASYTQTQIEVWLRGLLTIAWADGNFDPEEKEMIHAMVGSEFAPNTNFESLEPIEPAALVELELSAAAAQNFLRMAVMVALADGTYSEAENEQVMAFAEAIAPDPETLSTLRSTLEKLTSTYLSADQEAEASGATAQSVDAASSGAASSGTTSSGAPPDHSSDKKLDPLKPAREWLDQLSVEDPRLARFVCKLVPSQCPFERDVKLFGKKVVHIPPMCKINPLYEQLVGLRFRALSYLADDVGEDVTPYL